MIDCYVNVLSISSERDFPRVFCEDNENYFNVYHKHVINKKIYFLTITYDMDGNFLEKTKKYFPLAYTNDVHIFYPSKSTYRSISPKESSKALYQINHGVVTKAFNLISGYFFFLQNSKLYKSLFCITKSSKIVLKKTKPFFS